MLAVQVVGALAPRALDDGERLIAPGLASLLRGLDAAEVAKIVAAIAGRDLDEDGRALMVAAGFREVGRYEKQAQLEGAWKDVLLFEKLLPEGAGR